ncbi:MAG: hypothetical protein ACREDF_11085 [Thermoplasmata archaeon]
MNGRPPGRALGWRKHGAPPGLVKQTEKRVVEAGKAAARSIGKGIRRAIAVAAEYAVHLHRDDKMPKTAAVRIGARAVLNTVKKRR